MKILDLIEDGLLKEAMSAQDRYALTVMPVKAMQDEIRELIKRKKLQKKYKRTKRVLDKLKN
mgnify:CR=1 FL=1|jgi:hypothetical protein